jgi:hypothetical protein
MNRKLLALVALAALATSAGCLAYVTGGGTIDDETLDEEPPRPYAWNSSAGVHVTLTEDARFLAVYRINDSLSLYRNDGLGGQNAIPVSAVRFRYPNGTVVDGSTYRARGGRVERTRDSVEVGLPNDTARGAFAFTSESTPKRFALPAYVTGVSYEVVLPPDRRVEVFPFGNVKPGGFEVRESGDRRVVHWDSVESESVLVQFYLQRDLYIFGGIVAVLSVVTLLGVLYYRRKIERLQRRREEMAPGVDDDDSPSGPR